MPTVTIYTKPSCVQCDATIRQFHRRSAKAGFDITPHLELIDMSTTPGALEKVKAAGHQQAPVVEFEDESWAGFKPFEIEKAVTRLAEFVPDPEPTRAAA